MWLYRQTDRNAYFAQYSARGVRKCAFQNISIFFLSPPLHVSLLTILLSEERSHSLPPFIILITTLPFTRQTSSPLAQAQEGRLEETMKENCHLFPPCFFVVVSTAAEARQNALGRRKRERERLYVRVRGSIVYCLLCNSQRMALISRADCDTEPR